jgi:aspartyl-tRNA(Asn)/glutamyl-tRNA(Gln) amidotransferase subunit C
MPLTPQDIDHIAILGRLECSPQEREQFTEQLSSILAYIQQLQGVDTAGVEYRYHVDGLENVRAADEVATCDGVARENILDAFPDKVGDLLKVKGVFEE